MFANADMKRLITTHGIARRMKRVLCSARRLIGSFAEPIGTGRG
jgi:hypothetical protein